MNTKDFLRLGVPLGQATRRATDFISKFILGGGGKSRLHQEVAAIVANPSAFLADDLRKDFAKALLNAPQPPRFERLKYYQWGPGSRGGDADGKNVPIASGGGRRIDARCTCGLRPAHRRRLFFSIHMGL